MKSVLKHLWSLTLQMLVANNWYLWVRSCYTDLKVSIRQFSKIWNKKILQSEGSIGPCLFGRRFPIGQLSGKCDFLLETRQNLWRTMFFMARSIVRPDHFCSIAVKRLRITARSSKGGDASFLLQKTSAQPWLDLLLRLDTCSWSRTAAKTGFKAPILWQFHWTWRLQSHLSWSPPAHSCQLLPVPGRA